MENGKGDLISRAALLKKASRVTETDEGGWERVLRAVPVEEIEAAEAVDAASVVHGQWIEHESSYDGELECAHCHARFDGEIWYMQMDYRGWPKFCPNCGAKMDEEETDD